MRKLSGALVVALAAVAAVPVLVAAGGAHNGDRQFKANLTGAQEVPAVTTETSGRARFKADKDGTQIAFSLKITNATDILGAAGAHVHCAPAGSNGPVVAFLAGVVNGGLDGRVEIEATLTGANIVNPACGATIAELVQSMRDGKTYVNVHSVARPAGEIRGQITGGDDD